MVMGSKGWTVLVDVVIKIRRICLNFIKYRSKFMFEMFHIAATYGKGHYSNLTPCFMSGYKWLITTINDLIG